MEGLSVSIRVHPRRESVCLLWRVNVYASTLKYGEPGQAGT